MTWRGGRGESRGAPSLTYNGYDLRRVPKAPRASVDNLSARLSRPLSRLNSSRERAMIRIVPSMSCCERVFDVRTLIRAAKAGRDQLMLDVAYFGGLRVSERVSLNWGQVIRRDSGEAQLEVLGKGDKVRQVLIPAEIAARLLASRGEAPASAPVSAQ
jgi:site-specific recombinase XerD